MLHCRFLVLLAVAGAAGCAAAALPDKPVLKAFELKQTDFSPNLKSGLRVVVQEDHSSPVVTVVAAYGVGGTGDPAGAEGLAHFVEHLAFLSRFEDGVPIWDHLKRMGVDYNASTSWDFTTYFATAPKENLDRLLQFEAWRMMRLMNGITKEEFDREREVVRNERRLRGETMGTRWHEMVAAALFPAGHPLSRSVIGSNESLSAITMEHARAFAAKHYRPESCTIVVAGDVDAELVKKALGRWPQELLFGPGGPDGPATPPRRPVPAAQLPPPAPVTRALVREKGPVPQPQLILAWSGPGAHRGNNGLLQFVASRLDQALSEGIEYKEDDDLQGVGAGVLPLIHGSILLVQATLKRNADPEKARQRIMDALVNAWTTELGKLQTDVNRWGTATSLLLESADAFSSATSLAEHLLATGSRSYYKDAMDELAKIQATQVTDLAHAYLHRDRTVALLIEPESETATGPGRGGPGGSSRKQSDHQVGRDIVQNLGDLGSDRIRQVARPPGLAALPRWKLANGLEVVAVKHGTAPIARVVAAIKGGDAATTPYGLGSWATTFSTSKCSDHGSLAPVGGRLSGGTGPLRTTRNVEVLSGNLANGLAVLSDRLACMEADQERFLNLRDRLLEQRIRDYDDRAKMPDFQANKRFWNELYPQHPFGNTAVEPRALRNVTFDDSAAFVRAHFRPGNATLVVVGDIDPAETRSLTEKYFARWTGGGGAFQSLPPAPPAPSARKTILFHRPHGTQANVRIGCRLAAAAPEGIAVYDLAQALAEERASDVREKLGASYGVGAGVAVMPGGAAHMIISGAIENPQVGVALRRLLEIFVELGSDRLEEPFFLVKRWDVAREFWQKFSDGSSIAEHILYASQRGWPNDVWDRYPDRLAAATRNDVRALFKDCTGREVITLSGNAAEIRPQLEAAGLKPEAQ